jgi:hypothetical protein
MIANMREGWVKSMLRDKAANDMRLDLGLQDLPQYLLQAKRRIFTANTNQTETISTVAIADIFANSGQKLLILSAPGAGKSFLLAELALILLDRAEDIGTQSNKPLPIWVNLANWRKEDPRRKKGRNDVKINKWGFEDWLAENIHETYSLSARVTSAWLEADQICLLLDGLDEVDPNQQAACVEALNRFIYNFSPPVVVCSRSQEYTNGTARLNINRIVELQPLDEETVISYLSSSEKLEEIKKTAQRDRDLMELCTTPLFLDILSRSFLGGEIRVLKRRKSKKGLRSLIFNQYITQMFSRRPLLGAGYSSRQAVRWLRYLANQLVQRSRIVFYIENLQADWLSSRDQNTLWGYRVLVYGALFRLFRDPIVFRRSIHLSTPTSGRRATQ